MKFVLLLASLVLLGLLIACGSDESAVSEPPEVIDATPTLPPAPAATSILAPTPVPQATEIAAGAPPPTIAAASSAGASSEGGELKGIPVEGGVLMLLGSDPPTLDPHQAGDTTSAGYILELFGGLMTIDPNAQIVPDLAQEWSVSEAGTSYVFGLNPDATFHDGRTVTAADFKYSLERAASPSTESPSAQTFLRDIVGAQAVLDGEADTISGVNVIDEATLRIDVDSPKPSFLAKLTYASTFVVDRSNVESGKDWVRNPNGTGPFVLAEYEPGVKMRLEKFPAYHLGPAKLDAVEFNLAGGDGMLMYENDELHLGRIGTALVEALGDPTHPLHGDIHQGSPNYDVSYIGLNVLTPPFDDIKVRQALNYAVDRETLSNVLLNGSETPAKGILPPGFPAYNPDLLGYYYDPDKARQLLAESGYGSDAANYPDITMTIPGSFGAPVVPFIESLLATWEEQLGFTVSIQQTEWATFLSDLRDHRFEMVGGLGWQADYIDPENFLDVLFHSDSQDNRTGYSDPQLDLVLEKARGEQDQFVRFELYQKAEERVVEGSPLVPLFHSNGDVYLIKPYVKGLPLSPLVIPRYRFVYFIE